MPKLILIKHALPWLEPRQGGFLMRAVIRLSLVGVTLAGIAGCSPPAAMAISDLPHRKAGLWRQTMRLQGSDRQFPAIESCSDAASEAKLTLLGQHRDQTLCQSQSFRRNTDGSIAFEVACDLGPRGKTVSSGTISGDFHSAYKIDMASKTTSAPAAQLNGERKMTITSTWIGACAPGQRGGDMVLADGRRINLTDPSPGAGYP
jgi:hypothetical protein